MRAKEIKPTVQYWVDNYTYDFQTGRLVPKNDREPIKSHRKGEGVRPIFKYNRGYILFDKKTVGTPINYVSLYCEAVWACVYGKYPDGIIFPIDRNPLNFKIENLVDVPAGYSNLRLLLDKNKERGVYKRLHSRGWKSTLHLNGEQIWLGMYETKEEAIEERWEAAHELRKNLIEKYRSGWA